MTAKISAVVYVTTSVILFSTGHWIGGSVMLVLFLLM